MQLPDLPLNSDELRGFNLALACLMRWGSQIERNGITLGGPIEGPQDMVPRARMMAHGGAMVRHCAEALALTMGKPQRRLPAPQNPASPYPASGLIPKAG